MEALIRQRLANWLAGHADMLEADAFDYAGGLVAEGWTTPSIMLAEQEADGGDAEAFLGLVARAGDRRRLLLALEAHAAGERARREEVEPPPTELEAAEQGDRVQSMVQWLCEVSVGAPQATEAAALLAADGFDDVEVLCWEVAATGAEFLKAYFSRPGDVRRVLEAVASRGKTEDKSGEAPMGENVDEARKAGSVRLELTINGTPLLVGGSERGATKRRGNTLATEALPVTEAASATDAMRWLRTATRQEVPRLKMVELDAKDITAMLKEVHALCARDLPTRQRLGSAGLCTLVADAMEEHAFHRDLQREACLAASSLMTNVPKHVTSFEDLGLRRRLRSLQRRYASDTEMQMITQEAYARLDKKRPMQRAVETTVLPW